MNKRDLQGYLFISPWLAGFLVLTAFPFAACIYLSFTRYDIVSTPVWVGWANYRELFANDPMFWKSLWITLKYAMVATPLGIVIGVGLALLLPAYAIGGMGAGDVKLLAGVGAWVHGTHTFYAFCVSAIVGAVIAVGMVVVRRSWSKHANQFRMILGEVMTIRNPTVLAGMAAERKSAMLLLPYGIPIAIGTIAYFVWTGMLTGV